MFIKNKRISHKGVLFLKSVELLTLRKFKKEIYSLLKKNVIQPGKWKRTVNILVPNIEAKKSKYITIFRSPFVYKKSKESYLLKSYSCSIRFSITNLTLWKVLIAKLEFYKNIVDSSIKVNIVENNFPRKSTWLRSKFGTTSFKNLLKY